MKTLKNKRMNSGKVLLCIMSGVAAGAMLGILFAPEKESSIGKKNAKKNEDHTEAKKV